MVQVSRRPGTADALSVAAAFRGTQVLLTGATGYIGSLVLEQLLRTCPDVDRVFVLIRPKRQRPPAARLQQLLDNGLFHLLWKQSGLLDKVKVVEGDLLQPGCGLSDVDVARLRNVDIVIHAAASISFTDHILASLACNYHATARVAALAAGLPHLQAFVHVSTAYCNGHQPPGSLLEERLYPAFDADGSPIQHAAFVRCLEAMPPAEAEAYVARLAFPNSYCLTKWLAERLLAERHAVGFPAVIVRPAITGAVAGSPYPGYVGNRTGATGAALAIAAGIWLFSRHAPRSILDLVSGDAVSSAILLAAAAAAQDGQRHDRQQMRILHVGTSSSPAPLCTGRFYQLVRAFFSANPARHSLYAGDRVPRRVLVVRSPAAGAILEAYGDLKFALLAALLWLVGRRAVGDRVLDAWKAVKMFNAARMEFDLRFDMTALRQLAARLPPHERASVRPLWDPSGGGSSRGHSSRNRLAGSCTAGGISTDSGSGSGSKQFWQNGAVAPAGSGSDDVGCNSRQQNGRAGHDSGDGSGRNSSASKSSGEADAHADADADAVTGWERYMQTYMAGAAALCLRQPAGGRPCGSDFEFIAPRSAGQPTP